MDSAAPAQAEKPRASAIHPDRDRLVISKSPGQLAPAGASFHRPDFEKRGDRIKLLRQEIETLDELIVKLTKARDLEKDPAAQQALNQRIQGLQSDRTGLEVKRIGLENGADPNSYLQTFQKKWSDMQEAMGTLAQQTANIFERTFTGAIDKVSNGLTDMITGAKSVGEALTQIWQGIVTDIIHEIVRMGVQWVVTETLKTTVFAAGAAAREGVRTTEAVEFLE
jgi:phage-related protein